MLGKLKSIGRQAVTEDEKEPTTEISFKPREEMVKIERTGTEQSSISIPEFIVGEPYPYFYHTWNKLLMCNFSPSFKTTNTPYLFCSSHVLLYKPFEKT